ncbi:basic proline-rich protein precursor [Mycobacterium lepraemurium]|nr:basic proline-rich protein precursor [Mycobacterium lepraemurium]
MSRPAAVNPRAGIIFAKFRFAESSARSLPVSRAGGDPTARTDMSQPPEYRGTPARLRPAPGLRPAQARVQRGRGVRLGVERLHQKPCGADRSDAGLPGGAGRCLHADRAEPGRRHLRRQLRRRLLHLHREPQRRRDGAAGDGLPGRLPGGRVHPIRLPVRLPRPGRRPPGDHRVVLQAAQLRHGVPGRAAGRHSHLDRLGAVLPARPDPGPLRPVHHPVRHRPVGVGRQGTQLQLLHRHRELRQRPADVAGRVRAGGGRSPGVWSRAAAGCAGRRPGRDLRLPQAVRRPGGAAAGLPRPRRVRTVQL